MKAVVKLASILALVGFNSLVAQGYNNSSNSNPSYSSPNSNQYNYAGQNTPDYNRSSQINQQNPPHYVQMTAEDDNLARQIRAALKGDGTLSDNAKYIRLTVENGYVTLNGSLDTQEKAKVENLVRNINGVKSINNNINNNPR